jgi:hypothetical protein
MEKQEAHFKKLYDAAAAVGCKLKFVAKFESNNVVGGAGRDIGVNGNIQTTAKVGLQHIQPSSDFYHLYGKDNLVLFYSMRYQISKRWYVSTTIGPSLAYIFASSSQYKNSTGKTTDSKSSQFYFPNVGFISDISICFRL